MVRAKLAADRAALTAVGLAAVPLYVTEFGWTTSPPGALDYVPAATRPGYVRRTLDELGGSPCGVAAALLYTWYSPRAQSRRQPAVVRNRLAQRRDERRHERLRGGGSRRRGGARPQRAVSLNQPSAGRCWR